MRICKDPLCGKLISMNRAHVRVGDDYFCNEICRKSYMDANDKLTRVAHPLRYTQADECTCKSCAPPPDPGDGQLSLQF